MKIGIWILFGIWCLGFGIYAYAEEFAYNNKGKRDPFVPLIGAGAVYEVQDAINIMSIEDVSLEGILYDEKGDSSVILNSMVLKEGDKVGVAIIEKIEPDKVILVIGEEKHEVTLDEEKGGEGK